MKILMIAENDPSGAAVNLKNSANIHTPHTCRLITLGNRYNHMCEKDLHLPWLTENQLDKVDDLLKDSDVFHLHLPVNVETGIGPFKIKNYIKDKIVVYHHHGHPDFRLQPERYQNEYKDIVKTNLLVSTPDLLPMNPGAVWQPNVLPINDDLFMPKSTKPDSSVRLCHSPIHRELKNTDELLGVVKDLRKISGSKFELFLIENIPYRDCMRVKKESHILFDNLKGYFGMSSLEGLSLGLCVIAGLDEFTKARIHEFTEASILPWINATPETLKKIIHNLVKDAGKREQIGLLSRQFMEEHWNEKKVVDHLNGFYENAKY